MPRPADHQLSRRERQIMEVLYQCRRASAAQIRAALPDPPSYSTVRALLRILGEKGHVRHEEKDLRYVYFPTVPRERIRLADLRTHRPAIQDSIDVHAAQPEDVTHTGLGSNRIEARLHAIEGWAFGLRPLIAQVGRSHRASSDSAKVGAGQTA